MSYRTSSPRRSRFTVTVQKPVVGVTREVVLCYTPSQARDHYEGRGWVVLQVTAGDYRTRERQQSAVRGSGWRVDPSALSDACDLLGIKRPVDVRQHSRVGDTLANHRFDGVRHNIMVKSYLSVERATESLWHELTHAMQAERAGGLAGWQAERARCKGLYQRSPIEIEARRMQATMKDCMLTVPA